MIKNQNYSENNTLYLNTAKAWKEGNVLTVSGCYETVNIYVNVVKPADLRTY